MQLMMDNYPHIATVRFSKIPSAGFQCPHPVHLKPVPAVPVLATSDGVDEDRAHVSVRIWNMYGTCMEHVWNMYGICVYIEVSLGV